MVRAADTLLPQIASDFGITVGAASIVVTVYALTHGTFQLVVGPDRRPDRQIPRRRYRLRAVGGHRVAVRAGKLAQHADPGAVCLAGLAAAWILPLGLAYIGDVVPYGQRQQVLGRFLTGQVLGQLFGQAAGGVIGDLFGWRAMFFVLAAIFAFAAVALTYELVTNPVTHAGRGNSAVARTARRLQECVLQSLGAVRPARWCSLKPCCCRACSRSSAPTCICASG